MINVVDFVGYSSRHFSQKGGLDCALLRRGPVSPNIVPEKKRTKVCALGMGCGCHASAFLKLKIRLFGASAGTFRGHVYFVPPSD